MATVKVTLSEGQTNSFFFCVCLLSNVYWGGGETNIENMITNQLVLHVISYALLGSRQEKKLFSKVN